MTRWLAPEVVQTSAMDCGPAALKCLLEGHGVAASYGRLREACQTEVDGTSIDTLEDVAVRLGLEAEQIMVPADHVLLDEAASLPCIVVITQPNGFTHFVVAWRRHGPWVQIMDPATGRRFWSCEELSRRLYVHEATVPVEALREWFESEDFERPLTRRVRDLGCDAGASLAAAKEGGWRRLAELDAAVRMVAALVKSGAVDAGGDAERVLAASLEEPDAIPPAYFCARPAPPDEEGVEQAKLRGAVLLRVSGARAVDTSELPRDLARALAEPPARPAKELWRFVREGGWLTPGALGVAIGFAALGALVEAVLLRAALELPRDLSTVQQRLGGAVALIVFVAALRALDAPVAAGTLRLGRQIELRLRAAFLEKVPRLEDRYFQSRPISDMAERAHAINGVRALPELGSSLLRSAAEIVATTAAIAWFDPPSAPLAVATCLMALVVPVLWQPVLVERDLSVRTHDGALARLTLDGLLALMPLRTHSGESAMRREHESLLVKWARASRSLANVNAWAGALQYMLVVSMVLWMVACFVDRAEDTSGILLLVYWGLAFPTLSEELSVSLRQVPGQRNVTMRLLEPLGALEDERGETDVRAGSGGARVRMRGVNVVAGGHEILREVDLELAPGEHVAVVGPSGAGKSSLAGLLLGWHRPASGALDVDGEPLGGARLDALRRGTAWVDPSIQVWNRSLLENLQYGAEDDAADRLASVLESAEVQPLLDRLPHGMQTPLGEGGALVSGGEGQRVRLGRAMMRPRARLVVLDEPFRGLDRERRRALLDRARVWWAGATVVCITHDVGETLAFDRVLVVESGQIVEDGKPAELAEDEGSRYRAMLDAERVLLDALWGGAGWRRVRLEGGRLHERGGGAP